MRTPLGNWIRRFLDDERGAESIELGLTGAVLAVGFVAGLAEVRERIAEQQADLIAKIDAATAP